MKVLIEKIQERQTRHRSSATSPYQKENPLCSELTSFVVHSQLSEELYTYIVGELTNTNILASLAETCQLQLTLIQDEVSQILLPVLADLANKLSSLRAWLKPQSALGFDLNLLQSLIDANHA